MIIDRRTPARGAGRRLLFLMRLAASATAFTIPEAAYPQAAPGFNLCVQPGSPPCVFMPGRAAEACGAEVEAYIASVFHYRECLSKESERAIRESNDIIDHWRCRERGERCRQ